MQHPFSGILGENCDGQSRREHLQTVLQAGVGAVAVGMTGVAAAQITTQAIGEEGGKSPAPPVTRAGPGHPEHGGKRPVRPTTKAGPSHLEHAGEKIRNAMSQLATAQRLMGKYKWAEAAAELTAVRKVPAPKPDKFGHHAKLQKRREKLEKPLGKLIAKSLDDADKLAKSNDLVPAIDLYRQAGRLDAHYGVKKRVDKSLTALATRQGRWRRDCSSTRRRGRRPTDHSGARRRRRTTSRRIDQSPR